MLRPDTIHYIYNLRMPACKHPYNVKIFKNSISWTFRANTKCLHVLYHVINQQDKETAKTCLKTAESLS